MVPVSWSVALTRLAEAIRAQAGEARAVVSPFLSNEDLGAVRRVMDAVGGGTGVFRCEQGEEVTLPGFPTLALRPDRAANVVGAELLGFRRAGAADARGGLEEAAAHTGTLLVVGDELADAPAGFGTQASLFVYVGHFQSPAARNAHFVFPAATFAEAEGTFTNVHRRVQRFWPALQVPAMARPAWQILGVLLAGISDVGAPGTAGEAFEALAGVRPEFGGMTYADLGATGRVLSELNALAGD